MVHSSKGEYLVARVRDAQELVPLVRRWERIHSPRSHVWVMPATFSVYLVFHKRLMPKFFMSAQVFLALSEDPGYLESLNGNRVEEAAGVECEGDGRTDIP